MKRSLAAFLTTIAVCSGQAFVVNFDTFVTGDDVLTGPVGTLSIEQNGPDQVDFVLTLDSDMPEDSFISRIWLNIDPFVPDSAGANADSRIENFVFDHNSVQNAGYSFDARVDFALAPPMLRLGPGDSSTWSITGSGLTENHFIASAPPVSGGSLEILAMIQIQGIGPGNEGSAKWASDATLVPEPATIICLTAGIALLTRRRAKSPRQS